MPTYRNGQTGEIIETLTYTPGLQGGTDLEAATKTISATSEQAGADYTSIHTIAAPTDSRIAVLRGCMRLTVTIDSWGGGGVQLNYRVKRGGSSVSTGVLAVAAATGQKIISWDITTLITGAQTNTLFLWVDAGTCVISEATMWTGVGSGTAGAAAQGCLSWTYTGLATVVIAWDRVGTGTKTVYLAAAAVPSAYQKLFNVDASGINYMGLSTFTTGPFVLAGLTYIGISTGSVATDLHYISGMTFNLRSQP